MDVNTSHFIRRYCFFMRKCEKPGVGIRIKAESLEPFFASDDLAIMGALASFLTNPLCRKKVMPPLDDGRVFEFLLGYWKRCFIENPDSPWALSRYGAADDILASWSFFESESDLKTLTKMLKTVYREGDRGIQTCIETGLLEHLPRNLIVLEKKK